METGGSYADALRTAQQLGYAEADPTGDVEGWDAAAKAVILANTLLGGNLRIGDVDREGITGITPAMVNEARAANQRWKLIAQVSGTGDGVAPARRPSGGGQAASVRPTRLPVSDPLSQVGGGLNALTYSTVALGDVTLIGPGAGGQATGFAILSDLLKIHRATGRV
jgi:homoserine dehydrogenase